MVKRNVSDFCYKRKKMTKKWSIQYKAPHLMSMNFLEGFYRGIRTLTRKHPASASSVVPQRFILQLLNWQQCIMQRRWRLERMPACPVEGVEVRGKAGKPHRQGSFPRTAHKNSEGLESERVLCPPLFGGGTQPSVCPGWTEKLCPEQIRQEVMAITTGVVKSAGQ